MFKSFFGTRQWAVWAYGAGSVLLLGIACQVGIDVAVNNWFGSFYDMIQKALAAPGSVTLADYWHKLATFGWLGAVYVAIGVGLDFLVRHWVFRWRTAMSDFYVHHWQRLRTIEGASQRIQEDTMRFASLMETLGASLLRALMMLIAFVPILAALSRTITDLPGIGHIPYALAWTAVLYAVLGTALIMFAGRKLPGLEFNNQKVEAAFRKELVLGEEATERAQEPIVAGLFREVRANYIRLYLHFMYVDLTRYTYLQVGGIVPYLVLGPTLIAGGLTLGLLQQTARAFGKVETSLQYIINNWTAVVELMSVYKRLRSFERTLHTEHEVANGAEA